MLRLIRSDWLVVEHATRISDGEAPVDFDFGPIRPPVPGAMRQRNSVSVATRWRPRHCRDHRLASSSAGLSQLPMHGRVVHPEAAPQLVPLFRTEGCSERFFPMGVEVIQDQMNGARFGVAHRDPLERSCKLPRGPVFGGMGLMATDLGLDHKNTLAVPHRAYS